jgi:hypothetical protein
LGSELRVGAKALRMPDALVVATAELDPEVDSLLTGNRAVASCVVCAATCSSSLAPAD